MIIAQNILAHEVIGLHASIIESSDPTLAGVEGIIVFETKNTLSIRSIDRMRQIAKAAAKKIKIIAENGACFISGSLLIARPEDRISRL